MITSSTYNFKRVGAVLGVFGSSTLAYVGIKLVKVEGVEYDLIYSGTPTNRQVLYTSSTGVLQFGQGFSVGSKLFVMYQH